MRGISLGLYPGTSADSYRQMIDEIAAVGASHVALVVSWSQPNVSASAIAPGRHAVDDALVIELASRARDADLDVTVFPILDVEQLQPGLWRGTLRPDRIDDWWLSYERFILHYADLARTSGATALVVGSELGTTEGWRDRWYHLIGRVRRIFSGTVVYSANWDHYRRVSFWRRLDVLGVTGYFELTRDRDADVDELMRGWRLPQLQMIRHARRIGLPLWITEVGYPSRDGAAGRPWDYTSQTEIDLEEQRRAYEAFVRTWDRQPGLGGVFFWNWHGDGGPRDGGYTPRGKPAQRVLRGWFSAATANSGSSPAPQ